MSKILIVDDNSTDREFISEILLSTGLKYDLMEADSGRNALKVIGEKKPDLVLLDIHMSDLDGFQTLAEMRKDKSRFIPVILVSSFSEENDRIQGIESGAADFINKPIIPEELKARAASYLSLKKMFDDLNWVTQKTNEGIKMLYKDLEVKNNELQKLDEMKSEFVSTVSHELRTPLTIINDGLSIVLDGLVGEISDKQRDVLKKSRANVERLGRIINDLLDISKIEAGKIEINRSSTDINHLMANVVDSYRNVMTSKKINLTYEGPEGEVMMSVDQDKMHQILDNLLNNAYKFTGEGGHVEVALITQDVSVLCTVKDSGAGIEQSDMDKLFKKFQQISRKHGPGIKGTGLGLAICKALVELHGGKIWAQSAPDKGTTFYFTLPKNG